jgi:Secretion system C-terminal sorting domain
MKKIIATSLLSISIVLISQAQVTKILTAQYSRTSGSYADSFNLYYTQHLTGDVTMLDANDNTTVLFNANIDNMIANNGKVLYMLDNWNNNDTVRLYDGTNHLFVPQTVLPYVDFATAKDYFHIGQTTYFHTYHNIYKTDYTSVASIQKLYIGTGAVLSFWQSIFAMEQVGSSIYFLEYRDSASTIPYYLKKVDMVSGNVSIIDSSSTAISIMKYKSELYYNKYEITGSVITTAVKKISATEIISNLNIGTEMVASIVGVTPNGVLAANFSNELLLFTTGSPIKLNHTTASNRYPDVSGRGISSNSLVYFVAGDSTFGNTIYAPAIWVSDGTLAGTKKIIDKNSYNGSSDFSKKEKLSAICGNDIYFKGSFGNTDDKLFYINGSNLSYSVGTGQESIYQFYNINDRVYFLLDSVGTKTAIYKSTNACAANTSTAIANLEFNKLNYFIYPNPNNGNFTIRISDNLQNAQVKVYSVLGEMVYNTKIIEEFSTLYVNLKAGLYFVSVENGNQKSMQKIIVE